MISCAFCSQNLSLTAESGDIFCLKKKKPDDCTASGNSPKWDHKKPGGGQRTRLEIAAKNERRKRPHSVHPLFDTSQNEKPSDSDRECAAKSAFGQNGERTAISPVETAAESRNRRSRPWLANRYESPHSSLGKYQDNYLDFHHRQDESHIRLVHFSWQMHC